jgi:hypothetical protein
MCPIIFFNWNKFSGKRFAEIYNIFKSYTSNSELRRKYDGKSFLLKPDRLWNLNPNTFELFEVLQVASTRNHFYYTLNGYRASYLDFCGIDPNKLKYNRLLTIDENKRLIYLKHED